MPTLSLAGPPGNPAPQDDPMELLEQIVNTFWRQSFRETEAFQQLDVASGGYLSALLVAADGALQQRNAETFALPEAA